MMCLKMGLPSSRSWVFVCLVLTPGLEAWAGDTIWRYVDAEGVLHFSSEPLHSGSQAIHQSVTAARPVGRPVARAIPDQTHAARTFAVLRRGGRMDAVQASLESASAVHGVDFRLLKAVIAAESAFNPAAVSPKGAVGLMQVMPTTAVRYGVRPSQQRPVSQQLLDPELNIMTGTRYLADLMRMFDGQLELVLAAYNAGEGSVKRAGNRIPNFRETQDYVRRVMGFYDYLKSLCP